MVLITVGGPPGSGTSTLCRSLRDRLGIRYIYAGQIFRDMAKDRGLSLMEFSLICGEDPSVDLELDRRMLEEARKGDGILEGRMIGPLCAREDIPSIRIYVDADMETRAKRVQERDGGNLESVMEDMQRRERSETDRYLRYHGIDPADDIWYDMVIDSTRMTPQEEIQLLIEKFGL